MGRPVVPYKCFPLFLQTNDLIDPLSKEWNIIIQREFVNFAFIVLNINGMNISQTQKRMYRYKDLTGKLL